MPCHVSYSYSHDSHHSSALSEEWMNNATYHTNTNASAAVITCVSSLCCRTVPSSCQPQTKPSACHESSLHPPSPLPLAQLILVLPKTIQWRVNAELIRSCSKDVQPMCYLSQWLLQQTHKYLTFTGLHRTCSWWVTIYMGKPSTVGQPTRPTQPFILTGSITE